MRYTQELDCGARLRGYMKVIKDTNIEGAGTGTGVETRGESQDGHGSRDGNESSSGDGNMNEDGIGEGGEAKKRKKPDKSYRRDEGNEGDFVSPL